MCGITGIVSINSDLNSLSQKEIVKMTEIIKHRGPDALGYYDDQRLCFGNTRLKIIDLSNHANMPLANRDETIIITYNGEVTNYKELNKQFNLPEKYKFVSSSDTETVLHLYEELGIDFIKYLSGMFAFSIYDKKLNKVFIVRDFYGLRPLFYMIKNGLLYFSSEIKSFLELTDFSGEIDQQAIYHYFSQVYIPGTRTPFKDIIELDGGFLLEIDLNKKTVNLNEYYKIDYPIKHDMTEHEAIAGFYERMSDSMRRNMISDAPLGLTLSGGLDTSTMLALARKLEPERDIHTFSLKIDDPSFDESYYQRLMARHARSIHHEIVVTPENTKECFIKQMAYVDEPLADGATIPSYLLAERAKDYVKVLLSGEGGDEISNAYEVYGGYIVRNLYLKYVPKTLRQLIYKIAHCLPVEYKKLSFDFLAKRFTEGCEKNTPASHLYWRHSFTEEEKKILLPAHASFAETSDLYTELFNSLSFDDDLNKLAYLDIKYEFIGDLMVKNDRTFMAHSIEARFPFMDRQVVEFTNSIPTKYKIKGMTRRYFQKKAVEHLLPKKIFRRQGMGLEMPHSPWFHDLIIPLAKEYLTKKKVERTGVLNYSYVKELYEQHLSKKADNGRKLWTILNYIIWFDLFIGDKNYKQYL